MATLISIIVPVYNEEELINNTVTGLLNEATNWEYEFEIIFVNDGSTDKTYEYLKKESEKNARIKILNFSRNFGHQMAFTAGLDFAKGDAVIVIDGDLQDPPSVMSKFINKWEEGYHVVYGKRIKRKGETIFKLFTANLFYRLLDYLSDINIPRDAGDFRLMDRIVVDKINTMRERHRFIRGMVTWVGFNQTSVDYIRDERLAGETKYPFKKMLNFAFDGIFSFSITPIKFTILLGTFTVVLSFIGIIWAILSRLFTQGWVSGWTTLIIAILLSGGIQLISIGILGQYIGRTFEQIKDRPLYIIKDKINLDE